MSGPRAAIYAFGAALIALFAYYVDASSNEIALWTAVLATAIPFGALVMAAVKTWPHRDRGDGAADE